MSTLTEPTTNLDGPVGVVTQTLTSRRALFGLAGIAAGAAVATVAGLGAAPAHAAANRMVVWSTGANRVYLVENGKIKRTMKCIDNDWKTPPGTYSIWRWELAYSFYQGKKIWLENFAPFYRRPGATGNIGFHRVPIWAEGKKKGKQIHADSKLGDKSIESEGCIRLSDADIKATKKFAPAGTKIVVQKAAYKGGSTSGGKKEVTQPKNNGGGGGVPAFPAGLRPGAKHSGAVTLQRQLKAAGFMSKGEPEAPVYGPATQKAVGKFHNKHTQFRDRVSDPAIGPKGWAFLFTNYGSRNSTPPKTSNPKPSKPKTNPKPAGGKTYTVKPGDTLGSIASRHNVKGGYQAIAKKNGISNPNFIRVGQKLILP